jgi:hypothetical protein
MVSAEIPVDMKLYWSLVEMSLDQLQPSTERSTANETGTGRALLGESL